MTRSTRDVFEDHLRLREGGRLEEDLERNYADDVLLLSEDGPMIGHDALRTSAAKLRHQLPGGRFEYLRKCVRDEYAFLLWRGESRESTIHDGADTFVIRDGRIVMQSIHYVIREKGE
ncbi:MAG TPA: nuclear transport factor 2 family protein [Gammaproteobacteria bacterium]